MIKETKNYFERRLVFRPAWHRVDDDPKKNYGVHGVEIWFVLIGNKGAVHFGLYTGMMMQQTRDWWKARGQNGATDLFPMGVDVGYHSPVPLHDYQKEDGPVWPTKMVKKEGYEIPSIGDKSKTPSEAFEEMTKNITYEKIGDAPPNCEYLGVPCYADGSALRAEEWAHIFVEKGDDIIWDMLESEYKSTFS